MFKIVYIQVKNNLHKKESIITFLVLMAFVTVNYISNVITFEGYDVLSMFHLLKITLISYDRTNFNGTHTLIFTQLYPLLVVLPSGMILQKEKRSGISTYIASRTGYIRYYISRMLASFITTFIIFTVPFIIEMFINLLSFPFGANGNMANLSIYDPEYINAVNNYLFSSLYDYSIYLYYILSVILLGFVSGIFGELSIALSEIFKFKYDVLILAPVFFFLNASIAISASFEGMGYSVKWFDYFLLFNEESKNPLYLPLMIIGSVLIMLISIIFAKKKDIDC